MWSKQKREDHRPTWTGRVLPRPDTGTADFRIRLAGPAVLRALLKAPRSKIGRGFSFSRQFLTMDTTTTQGAVQSLENSEQISRIPGHTQKMVKSRMSNLTTFYNLLLHMDKNLRYFSF